MWRYTLPRCMWFVYGGLLKQGTTATPRAGTQIKIGYYPGESFELEFNPSESELFRVILNYS